MKRLLLIIFLLCGICTVARGTEYNILAYGADATGVADSAPALRSAIAANEAAGGGGAVLVPQGTFRLATASGGALATITKNVFLRGLAGSVLSIDSGVSATTDVFLIKPAASFTMNHLRIEGLSILPASGTPARHAFSFDMSNTGCQIRDAVIFHNIVRQIGGRSVVVSSAGNDGFFTNNFLYNWFYGAPLFGSDTGDSNVFLGNHVTSNVVDQAFEITQVNGSANFILAYNFISNGGGIVFHRAKKPIIVGNNIEVANAALSNTTTAMLWLRGDIGTIEHPTVRDNTFIGGNITMNALKIDTVNWAYVDGNSYGLKAGSFFADVGTTANGSSFVLNVARLDQGGGVGYTGAGVTADPYFNTQAAQYANLVWASYTPTISAGSGAISSSSAKGFYNAMGNQACIRLSITITANGTGAATVNASLPFTASNQTGMSFQVSSGRANGVSGKALSAIVASNSNTLQIRNYDGTYPGADGEVLEVQGCFEKKP